MIHAIILPVTAGLILFLIGMKLMETSLQTWAGPRLQLWLERFTRTPVRGLITGTVLTAALQSSTAITVIAIGLVGAGVLSFPRTLGVILGTNIGTCLTTELIGLSIGGIGVPILHRQRQRLAGELAGRPLEACYSNRARPSPDRCAAATAVALAAQRPLRIARCGWLCSRAARHRDHANHRACAAVPRSVRLVRAPGANKPALGHPRRRSRDCARAQQRSRDRDGDGPRCRRRHPRRARHRDYNRRQCRHLCHRLIAGLSSSRAGRYVAWSHVLLNVGGAILFYPFIHQLASLSAY